MNILIGLIVLVLVFGAAVLVVDVKNEFHEYKWYENRGKLQEWKKKKGKK